MCIIKKSDYRRIKELIIGYEAGSFPDRQTKKRILFLKEKLNKAKKVDDASLGLVDIVYLNSAVRFKNISTAEEKEYLFVIPKIECKELGRVSVLSNLGIALLGHKKGDTVEVKESDGSKYSVQVLKIQPTSELWIKRLEQYKE